jgi:hypothetical protein
MKRLNKTFSVVFIVLQLGMVAFSELGHTDLVFSLGVERTLSSHDGGAHERNRDISLAHNCQACYRTANTVASAPARSVVVSGIVSTWTILRPQIASFTSTDYYTSASKRGPPSFLS